MAPKPKFTPTSDFSYKITPNFKYGEFCNNEEARRFTHQYQCATAKRLADFLEDLRTQFGGKSVIITSGHRPTAINAAVGGSATSEHLYNGANIGAVDVKVQGADCQTVETWILDNWDYSVGKGMHANKGFTHIGMRADQASREWDY